MDITIERFYAIHTKMQAFSLRDIQAMSVMLTWGEKCGFSLEELRVFLYLAPIYTDLHAVGYFTRFPSVEQSRKMKVLESRLPKRIRRDLRRARLSWTGSGPLRPQPGCGCGKEAKVPAQVAEVLF